MVMGDGTPRGDGGVATVKSLSGETWLLVGLDEDLTAP